MAPLASWATGFFGWHYLLRRAALRLPARESLALYALVSAVAALVVPQGGGKLHRLLGSFVVLLGGAALVRRPRARPRTHFDTLAQDYATQLSADARARVVARKSQLTLEALERSGVAPGALILDVGCGHGWYLESLSGHGFRPVGVDLSPLQLMAARRSHAPGVPLVAASATALPFRDAAMHGALAVNVLHHLEDEADQVSALAELARVTQPSGPVLVHEINTRNPLFRFYMVYVFPLLKRIDLGTERWLDARRLPVAANATLERVDYYTFLPDFTPPALYRRVASLEARLEASRALPWSAHFTAHYRVLA